MKYTAWIGPLLLGVFSFVVACEESTSGADVVAVLPDAGTLSVDAGTRRDAGSTSATDGSTTETSACVACAATKCQEELTTCGNECLQALACSEACETISCRESCLRGATSVAAGDFKHCFFPECEADCPGVKALGAFIGLYATLYCTGYQNCASGSLAYNYGDLAGCQAAIAGYYQFSSMLPGSGISVTTLEACGAQLTGMTCEDFSSSRLGLGCQIQGTRHLDEACEEDSQCESSFCPGPNRTCAKCKLQPSLGDACIEGRCAPGLACNDANTCVGSARLGRPCNANAVCEVGNCVAGICEPFRTLGEECDPDNSVFCSFAQGLTCSDGACVSFSVATSGDSCTGETTFCANRTACRSGICDPPPKLGEACDDDTGPYCRYPTACVDGKCSGFVFPFPCE